MGSKRKVSQVFGKGKGKHQQMRKQQHRGRPLYILKRNQIRKFGNLKLKIKKTYSKFSISNVKKPSYISQLLLKDDCVKLRIKKVRNACPEGYRIINLSTLQSHVSEITLHVCLCAEAIAVASTGKAPLTLLTETRNLGLACVFAVQCKGCQKNFTFDTSPRIPGSKRFDINVRAVWGSMTTGNGPSHLTEMLGTMNSPGLSTTSFTSIEREIGEWWLEALESNILEAGAEEKHLAIERQDYHQEVPAITVITDGGWSKRTHKHTYNALGGVAIIIGKETRKLLHIGVRNKYCYICQTAKNKQTEAQEHQCFKNWDSDSQSMEADIITEGFQLAESKHGLRYMRIIGDGDSSVFAKIRDEVDIWGRDVTKEECANHVCKCYRSNLEKLTSDNPLYKGKHHLTKKVRIQLVSAVRCAIRVRSQQKERKELTPSVAISKLRHDISNSVHHIFGNHQNCSEFCKVSRENHDCTQPEIQDISEIASKNNSVSDILDEQIQFWQEGTSPEELEKSRFGCTFNYQDVEKFIIQDVSALLHKISEKADRLIGNSTTNLAESWMHIRCKFDGGKIHNLCNSGSWHARCYGGALRMNYGSSWSPSVWEKSTETQPGCFFKKVFQRQEAKLISSSKYQKKPETKKNRFEKKISSLKQSTTSKAKRAYGPDALEVTEDITQGELTCKKEEYLKKHIHVTSTQIKHIENCTRQQSSSGIWHTERKKKTYSIKFWQNS